MQLRLRLKATSAWEYLLLLTVLLALRLLVIYLSGLSSSSFLKYLKSPRIAISRESCSLFITFELWFVTSRASPMSFSHTFAAEWHSSLSPCMYFTLVLYYRWRCTWLNSSNVVDSKVVSEALTEWYTTWNSRYVAQNCFTRAGYTPSVCVKWYISFGLRCASSCRGNTIRNWVLCKLAVLSNSRRYWNVK